MAALTHPPLKRTVITAVVLGVTMLGSDVSGQESDGERTEIVLRLLPEGARADATVILREGSGVRTHQRGDGPFICVSDATEEVISMSCHHRRLAPRLALERQIERDTDLKGRDLRDRICTEARSRGMTVDPGAMEVSATLTRGTDGRLPTEVAVYRLLWLPYQTAEPWAFRIRTRGRTSVAAPAGVAVMPHLMWSEIVPLG